MGLGKLLHTLVPLNHKYPWSSMVFQSCCEHSFRYEPSMELDQEEVRIDGRSNNFITELDGRSIRILANSKGEIVSMNIVKQR